ncbi:MAG: hypothetical protein ABJK59_03960, partial [Erythrobacter sp.]|uniref:hypothetical protein n=1 Tax=Erythrobacter sp. TaxID=1042 RepID=UPI00329A7EAE
DQLLAIADEAPEDKKFYFQYWAGDVYIGLGELEQALKTKPSPPLGKRNSMQTDSIMSLKLTLGQHITGADVATIFDPKLTKFGRENIDAVANFLNIKVGELQKHEGRNFLREWMDDAYIHPHGMPLFNGHVSYVITKKTPQYHFSLSPTAEAVCSELMRDAENTYREERAIPRVGEGWIAETQLYYEVKEALADEEVIQHGRPKWLGRQHLDVYLPNKRVALEYQGEQHDRPIAFFGGEEAFKKNLERDRRKLSKCRSNGVRIIYVRQGHSLDEIIQQILLSND